MNKNKINPTYQDENGQLTREGAIWFAETKWWEKMPLRDAGNFALRQRLLCMPFVEYHKAINALLGRHVYSHEIRRRDLLILEADGLLDAPSMQQIEDMIPADKLLTIIDTDGNVQSGMRGGETP